jgi:plastocyanin
MMSSYPFRRLLPLSLLAGLILLGIGVIWWQHQRPHEVVFAVPPGTVARQAAGTAISVLPATITLQQNDVLIIRNDDTVPVQIGPFPIMPGQRFVQQYFNAGTYDLVCTIHQGQRLRIVVE